MNSPIQSNFQNPNTPRSNMIQGYTSNIISIRGGREAAKQYPVASGYTALMLDEENQMFFVKTNDINGIPQPLREFKYEEITPTNVNSFDPSNFVTKDDFNNLLNEIKKLQPHDNYSNNKNNRRNNND